jgi:hypothetical protein
MAVRVVGLILAGAIAVGCNPPVTPPPSTVGAVEMPWTSEGIDPAPGPVVAGFIATQIGVPSDSVEAAVFLFDHPARNRATVWVFRAIGLTSDILVERWVGGTSEARCPDPGQPGQLAGLEAVIVHAQVVDQCQPEYVVRLDVATLAVITDDGGYGGNAQGVPPPAPYRPVSEIEPLVQWLVDQLATLDLKPGGTGA